MALFIGIPYGTNASMSIESFLQKRNSNNPLEQIRNPLQWKHDSKRKVSQYVKSHNIALLNNFRVVHSALYRLWCTSKWLHGFLTSIFENFKSSYEPSRQRYAEYKRSRNCCKKNVCNNQGGLCHYNSILSWVLLYHRQYFFTTAEKTTICWI